MWLANQSSPGGIDIVQIVLKQVLFAIIQKKPTRKLQHTCRRSRRHVIANQCSWLIWDRRLGARRRRRIDVQDESTAITVVRRIVVLTHNDVVGDDV